MTRASLDKQPRDVAAMFDGVARRYDVTNTVLTGGLDWLWRRRTRQTLQLRPDETVLDLAAGTGVSTQELARSGARAIACDFSPGMVHAGAGRRRGVRFVVGDALNLPFADDSFDAVTISFGLRNVADVDRALRELARVTRPGGRLVVCEFSRPTLAVLRLLYYRVALRLLTVIARGVSSNTDAYGYLAESIKAWPPQADLARRISAAGWTEVSWRNLTGGIVALHRGMRV